MDEITALVAEYNAAEEEQRARLYRLYELLKARNGYRRVVFGKNTVWSNCWQLWRVPADLDNMINRQVYPISEVSPGE